MFEQVPLPGADPAAAAGAAGAALLTAHWASVAQHGEWIASDANRADLLPRLLARIDPARLVFFHVDGVEAFPCAPTAVATGGAAAAEEEVLPVLRAPVVSVVRCRVVPGGREAFEAAWPGADAALHAGARPYGHRGGWRIEKEAREDGDGEWEEYVVVGGWENVERAGKFFASSSDEKGAAKEQQDEEEARRWFQEAVEKVTVSRDVKLFKRFV